MRISDFCASFVRADIRLRDSTSPSTSTSPSPSLELRGTLGDQLTISLDRAFEFGHLLAQPSLLESVH